MYTSQDPTDGLRESIEHHVQLLADERSAFAQDYAKLLRVASFFAPPPMELLFLALLIIDDDDLFLHSWQPPVSLALFWEIRYEMLPANPFPSLAHAVITPF